MNKIITLFLLLFVMQVSAQQGGMWIPSLLDGMNEKEMKSLGMKMSAKDIYDVNKSSLKDAVPQFNNGCTAEMISPNGLLLTNHHCGFGQIQSHSSVENDYLTNGFWAYNYEQELPNPNTVVTFIVKIADVTSQVLEGTQSLTEAEKQKKVAENISAVSNSYPKESWQENRIRNFYEGNQYILFVTETFKDIRLVGAPPSAIGNFGSVTDNWVWPRHTGDFSLFRIYADKNNRPAAYSKDNVPYKPKHYLPISLDGIKEDDFTLVMGYPGRTTEYLPAVAVEQTIKDLNPAKIGIRDKALKVIDGYMRSDAKIKIQYASKYSRTSNYWKKWIGESQGLVKSGAVAEKRRQEQKFQQKVLATGKQAQYGTLLTDFERLYTDIKPYAVAREYFNEVVLQNSEILNTAYKLYQLEQIYNNRGEQSFNDRRNNLIAGIGDFYKDYNVSVDRDVTGQLLELYATGAPKQFMPSMLVSADTGKLNEDLFNSALTTQAGFTQLLEGDYQTVLSKLNQDKAYLLVKNMADRYIKDAAPEYERLNLEITALQRKYIGALLELGTTPRMFPDANSTLRVTYGKVKPYSPRDGVTYASKTYLDGVMEKYVPGDYEFDVPARLIELYEKKDYGRYGEGNRMPVCFIGTNHTTGGNSGSPAIDAKGNLIGLNFDRVWEGTMSDIYYDPEICRNIMVDIRYVLFIIDKYAGADNLIKEMNIIQKKKK
jgi:hypothetical protein